MDEVHGPAAPGAGPGRLGDGVSFALRMAGDSDGGEDEDAVLHREGAQELAAHQDSGEVART